MGDLSALLVALLSVALGVIGGRLYERRWFKSFFKKDRDMQHEVSEKKDELSNIADDDIILDVADDGTVNSVKPRQKTD